MCLPGDGSGARSGGNHGDFGEHRGTTHRQGSLPVASCYPRPMSPVSDQDVGPSCWRRLSSGHLTLECIVALDSPVQVQEVAGEGSGLHPHPVPLFSPQRRRSTGGSTDPTAHRKRLAPWCTPT